MSRAGPTTSPPAAVALYAQPSDVTLVKDFLRPWVTSGDTKAGGGAYVHAADVYSADPEELARRFVPAVSPDGGDRTWFFLSPLRSKSPRDRRKVRAVADGTGCWHSEAAPRNVVDHLDGGRHVGYRQAFSFMRRRDDGGAEVRAGWIMTEFHLHHYDDLSGCGRKVEGLVLCKVYRSPRNRGHVDAVALDCGHDVVSSVSSPSTQTMFYCSQNEVVDNEDSNGMTSRRQWRTNKPAGTATATMMTAAPLLEKKVASDEDVSGVTTATAPCPKNKAVTVDNDDDLLASPHARKKMRVAVADTESSGITSPLKATSADAPTFAPCPKKAVAVDHNDLLTSSPARKKMRVVAADAESSDAPTLAPCPKKAVVVDDGDLLTSSPARKQMKVAVVDAESSGVASPLKTTASSAPAAAAQLHCSQCGFHLAALQALVTLTRSKSVVPGEMQEI